MTWLLVLTITIAGHVEQQAVGVMISREACAVAGAGMIDVLEAANPGVIVEASCLGGQSA